MSKKRSLKIELPHTLWERLKYYSKQFDVPAPDAVEKLLDQYLPNLTGGLAEAIERLSPGELQLLETSFYFVVYLVSYADENISFLESLSIENEFNNLEAAFGEQFSQLVNLPKDQRNEVLQWIKTASHQDIIIRLLQLRSVLDKLPGHLMEEYKVFLLDSGVHVAQASKDGLFSGDRVSAEEKNVLYTITFLLQISVEQHAAFFDANYIGLQRLQLWKRNQKKMTS